MNIIETMEDSSVDLNMKSEDQPSFAEEPEDRTSTLFTEITERSAHTAIATITEESETPLSIVNAIIEELIQTSISIAIATIAKKNRPSTSPAEISETTAITTTAEKNETSHTIVTAIIDELIQISTSDASCEEPKQISMYATPSMAETCEEPTSTIKISTESNQVPSSTIPSATGANIFTATATCADPDPTSNFSTTSTYAESVNAAPTNTVNNHLWDQSYTQSWPKDVTFSPYLKNTTPRCNDQPAQPSPPNFNNRASNRKPHVRQPYNMPKYSYHHQFSRQCLSDWYWSAPCMPQNSYLQQPSYNYEYSVPFYSNYQPDPIMVPVSSFEPAPYVLPTPQTAYYPGPQGFYYESPDINHRTPEAETVTNTNAPVLNNDMVQSQGIESIRYPTGYKNDNTKYNKPTTLSYADVLKKKKK